MKRFSIGFCFFLSYLALSYGLFVFLSPTGKVPQGAGTIPLVLVACMGIGFVAQLSLDWDYNKSFKTVFLRACATVSVFAVLLVLVRLETLICVIMLAPVLLFFLALGMGLLRFLMALIVTPPKLAISLLALPFVLNASGVTPPTTISQHYVQTTVIIDAPMSDLAKSVQSVSTISPDELPWTFTHSILRAPRPLSADTIGGIRYARWTKGIYFEEHLEQTNDQNSLYWRFAFPDLAAMQALDYRVSPIGSDVIMQRGGYEFRPLPDARTEVTLTTHYQLNTPINRYLSFWGELFLQDMHQAVLHVVKNRAEATTF